MTDRPTDPRPVAYLGMPNGGTMTNGAAKGFFTASPARLNVQMRCEASSLLALNFNQLWVWMLNARHRGERVDYFAMQHSDIEPQDVGWLDTLIDELEARDLDVLGVVAPIKDRRGVTSIALGRPDGDTWRVHTRLTMREVFRLPETFTSEDLGFPLLLNTGLWVAKVGPWCEKVYFTVNDRIVFNETLEVYQTETEPEDWFFSRLLHELGLKVGCTRKVGISHNGPMGFPNQAPWGEPYDAAHLSESIFDAGDRGEWFPHEVAGWLTPAEGKELARLAAGKSVLEVGSYCGRSTICLARTARTIGAIDTFDGRCTPTPGGTLATFRRNLIKHGLDHKVTVYRGEAAAVMADLPPVYDLVFVDGAHDYDSVRADAAAALRLLRPGGLLAFHDYMGNEPGVTRTVQEILGAGGELLAQVDSLAVVRPPAAVPQPLEV